MEKLYCVLNAAEGQLDIHLCNEERILVAQSWHAPTRGAEILTPALQSVLKLQKLQPDNITHFACVHGPGSFTGIRLIMGTVAALRRFSGASNVGLDYMQALALTAQQALQVPSASLLKDTSAQVAVFTHARRNLVHAQFFTLHLEELPKAHAPAHLLSPEEALQHMQDLSNAGHTVYALGSGLVRNVHVFNQIQAGIVYLSITQPSPEALYNLALAATYHKNDLEPLYVRPCDAVENLDHIAQKQGMDSAKAHATLEALLKKETLSDV